MPKKISNIALVLLVVIIGFIRSYMFYNIHYAKYYIIGKYPKSRTDSWLQFLDNLTVSQIDNIKWLFTLIFISLFFTVTAFFIKINFKSIKGVIFLYCALLIFAAIFYFISLFQIPYTFQISRRSLHFLQSPLPAGVLFLYYKFILPLNTNRSIEQRK